MSTETLDAAVEEKQGVGAVRVTRTEAPLAVARIDLGRLGSGWRLWLVPVALLALAGALFAVNDRHAAGVDAGQEARRVVATHVEELLSYDYREIEDELARERDWLTGDFADEYAALVSDEIAPAAAKVEVVTEATVSAGGVVSASRDEVELLLFVNVTTRSSELSQPRVAGSRLAVTAEYVDGAWRISALDPV